VTWSLVHAARVHLLGRNAAGVLGSLVVGMIAVFVALHRQFLLPFSAGIMVNLPPFAPYCYTFTAVLLTSPRFYDLECPGAREVRIRALVLLVSGAAFVGTGAFVAFDDVGLAGLTIRNACFFFGLGLGLCRLFEPALAALVAGVTACLLAFLGSTPDGSVRSWAWLLLGGESVKAAAVAVAVLGLGLWLDLTRRVPVGRHP